MAFSLSETLSQLNWPIFIKNNKILKVILIFVEEGRFRSKRGFSQKKKTIFAAHFAAAKWGSLCCEMALCAKIGFAASKYPAKWSFGCEIGNFYALELLNGFAAAKWGLLCCEMTLVCQTWFRRGVNWAAKWFRKGRPFSQRHIDSAAASFRLRNDFAAKC